MQVDVARDFARDRHAGQHDRLGHALIEHVERVAARVPPRVRALAWVHDLLERTPTGIEELRARGLLGTEEAALRLLTRAPDQPYELYVLEIAHAPGLAGEFARVVKIADLGGPHRRPGQGRFTPGMPPYRWALRHLLGRPVPVWAAEDHWFGSPAPAPA